MNKRLTEKVLASLLGLTLVFGCSPAPAPPQATVPQPLAVKRVAAIETSVSATSALAEASADAAIVLDAPSESLELEPSSSSESTPGPRLQIPPSDRPGLLTGSGELPPLPSDDWDAESLTIDEELALLEGAIRLPPVTPAADATSLVEELHLAQTTPAWSLSRRLQRARDYQHLASQAEASTSADEVDADAELVDDASERLIRLSPVDDPDVEPSYGESSTPVWNGPLERLPELADSETVSTPSTSDPPLQPAGDTSIESSQPDRRPPSEPAQDSVEPENDSTDEQALLTPEPEASASSSIRPRSLDELAEASTPHRSGALPSSLEQADAGPSLAWPATESPHAAGKPSDVAESEPTALPPRGSQPEPLPRVAAQPPARPAEMDAVACKAIEQIRGGFLLARRGALYVARTEFIGTMRLIAQAQDARDRSDLHTRALADGLRALDEADDLIPRGTQLGTDIDVERLVARHRTPVGHDIDLDQVSATELLSRYYTFAQERLAEATGREPAGSMALHGLGKVHAILAREDTATAALNEPKSMVYHQSALLVDPSNYLAANDLGVLLARYGRLAESRELLLRSATIWPHAQTYENLANIHRQLGEHDLAQRALEQSVAMAHKGPRTGGTHGTTGSRYGVRWVSPQELAGGPKSAPQQPRAAVKPKQTHVDRRASLDQRLRNSQAR